MAHSPTEAIALDQAKDYFANWDALSTMITRGRSFSGRERHCGFLNVKKGPFAKVSGATGLDLIDDGRGLAVSDWDGDGDLDLWLTQRNGPRIRFLRNDVSNQPNALTFELKGATCNRDAIGARLTARTSKDRVLTQTVRAGDSFLSQSTKALHVGLEEGEEVDSVSVLWPGAADAESFSLEPQDRRFALKQGTGMAMLAQTPKPTTALQASIPTSQESPDKVRHVLIYRKELPEIRFVDFKGDLRTIEPQTEGPTLINLWASWCAPCVKELKAFAQEHKALTERKLKILALSSDPVTDDGSRPDLTAVKELVRKEKYPFGTGLLDAKGVQTLTLLHHQIVAHQRPLALPSSFLVDPSGKVAVVYKGPVTVKQLLEDIDLIEASSKVIESASFPFAGRNGVELFTLTPLAFAQAYQAGGYLDDARESIRAHLDSGNASLREHYYLGTLEQARSNWKAAASAYKKVLQLAPENTKIHVPLAVALWRTGDKEQARTRFDVAAKLAESDSSIWLDLGRAHLQIGQPTQAVTYFKHSGNEELLASALIANGQAKEGIQIYESILTRNPDNHQVTNQLAWTLATHPEASVRNPKRALALANQLGDLSRFQDPHVLNTLGAAQASAGDFDNAVQTAVKARQLARATGMSALATNLNQCLDAYQSGKSWRSH